MITNYHNNIINKQNTTKLTNIYPLVTVHKHERRQPRDHLLQLYIVRDTLIKLHFHIVLDKYIRSIYISVVARLLIL